MESLISLARISLRYGLQVLIISLAGTLPPALFFLSLSLASPHAALADILHATAIAALACLLLVVLPFCFFVAAPIAIVINYFVKLDLTRTLLLAMLLSVPGIIFLDYWTYLSSGPDSGPPTEPYSFSRFIGYFASPSDTLLIFVIPATSALLCGFTLWFVRFREH